MNWQKQISLAINPERAERIHRRNGQFEGNNVPCTMCGAACVYIMLPQQRRDTRHIDSSSENEKEKEEKTVRLENSP